MEIEEVVQYKVGAQSFSSKEEAEKYIKEKELFNSIYGVVSKFFTRYDMDEDDIVEGIIEYKSEILEILKQYD